MHDFNLFTFDTNILVLVLTHVFTVPLFILSLFPLIFCLLLLHLSFVSFSSLLLSLLNSSAARVYPVNLCTRLRNRGRWKSYCWVTSEVHLLWCDRSSEAIKYELTWSFSFTGIIPFSLCLHGHMCTWSYPNVVKIYNPQHPEVTHLSASSLTCSSFSLPPALILASTACPYGPLAFGTWLLFSFQSEQTHFFH